MNLELQGTEISMMFRGGLFSTLHLTVPCAFKPSSVYHCHLPAPFQRGQARARDPHKALGVGGRGGHGRSRAGGAQTGFFGGNSIVN